MRRPCRSLKLSRRVLALYFRCVSVRIESYLLPSSKVKNAQPWSGISGCIRDRHVHELFYVAQRKPIASPRNRVGNGGGENRNQRFPLSGQRLGAGRHVEYMLNSFEITKPLVDNEFITVWPNYIRSAIKPCSLFKISHEKHNRRAGVPEFILVAFEKSGP